MKTNDFTLHIATSNGSGSQSANNIIVKSLFRMGIPVSGKNLFPSNIQGLPTWFSIRVSHKGYKSRGTSKDLYVAMNADSVAEDIQNCSENGIFIYNDDLKFDRSLLREDLTTLALPIKKLVAVAEAPPKLRKLLANMVYVGVLADLLGIDQKVLEKTVSDFFRGKSQVIEPNSKCITAGAEYSRENFQRIPLAVEKMDQNQEKILVDGNFAGALGLVEGGAGFAAWYPITPSSSVMESFIKYASVRDHEKESQTAVVQAEDELASIAMVAGAGWSGARAFTATSGPGLSLMAECAGFCYFAEIPAVIWDVQRVGPSTGLPTRTMQGDLESAYRLSHGDTEHIVLLPGTPKECFEFGQTSLDLAEQVQTLVIVLTDLDLGMNFHISEKLEKSASEYQRGKLIGSAKGDQEFQRYADLDGDGIPYRSLPGDPLHSYFTRGTGHTPSSSYSESPEVYKQLVLRLQKKFESAKNLTPKPEIVEQGHPIGMIVYGSTEQILDEVSDLADGKLDFCRIRSLPFHDEIEDFISRHEKVFVVDQNLQGQMHRLLLCQYPDLSSKLISLRTFDGQAISAQEIYQKMESQ